MSSSAGRVLLISKGDYSASAQYSPMDYVLYQGSTYVCKQASQGNAPTNTTYWQCLAQGVANAAGLSYSNSTSGLEATDVQAAIDEIDSVVDTVKSALTNEIDVSSKVVGNTTNAVGIVKNVIKKGNSISLNFKFNNAVAFNDYELMHIATLDNDIRPINTQYTTVRITFANVNYIGQAIISADNGWILVMSPIDITQGNGSLTIGTNFVI